MKKEVFVTYSWDSEEHKNKVISFCDLLRKKGFHATMDRKISQEQTAPNFMKMMHQAMTDYQKVIVILTEKYKEKADSFSGGVGVEYNLIINDIDSNPKKYVLVSFDGISDKILPMAFKGREIIDISTPEKQQTLFAKLQDKEVIEFSPVAPNKPHVAKKEIQDFNEIQNKNIELIDIIAESTYKTSMRGDKFKIIDCDLKIILKNISYKSINEFYVELILPKALTRDPYIRFLDKVPKISPEEKKIFKCSYDEKLFPNQKQEIKIGNLYVIGENAKVAFAKTSNLKVKVYTDDGDCKFKRPIKDLLILEETPGKNRDLELKDIWI